jgi:hypothetical protein
MQVPVRKWQPKKKKKNSWSIKGSLESVGSKEAEADADSPP